MEFPFPLPKPLPHEQQLELVEKAQNGDVAARKLLISSNMKLIVYWASKYQKLFRGDPEELVNVAAVGAGLAINKFDKSRCAKFTPIMIAYMRRELSHFIVANVSSVRFATSWQARGNFFKISRMLAKNPNLTAAELAEQTNVSKEHCQRIITVLKYKDTRLDKQIGEDSGSPIFLKDFLLESAADPSEQINDIQKAELDALMLHEAIETLPELQQKIVRLYLLSEPKRTLVEVAQTLKISREWVRKQAELAKQAIKEYLEGVE